MEIEYEDKIKFFKILSNKERIIKEISALLVLLFIFAPLVHLTVTKTFTFGFIYSFIIWFVIKIFVVFVIDIL